MLNPYALIAAGLVWLASLAGVGTWTYWAGSDGQKVADQREFDRIAMERTRQADQAAVMYRAKQAEVIAALGARDQFKHQIEEERNVHREETDTLRARYAGLGLRFRPAEGAVPGDGGRRAAGTGGNAPGPDTAAAVQLPDAIAANLRQLAFDADRLAGEYTTCYRWATGSPP